MSEKWPIIRERLGQGRVKRDEPMSSHTTFGIGGPADLFYEARTEEEVIEAVKLCRELAAPYFILGGGSNLLVSDRGVRGVVIKISNIKYKQSLSLRDQISNTAVVAEAGVRLAELVEEVAKRSLTGLEFLVGIPGTVGGAIVGNAGAWQQAIGDKVGRVKVLDQDNETRWIARDGCQFGYRQSCFQGEEEIVLGVELNLVQGKTEEIKKKMEEYRSKRNQQPKEPSAGSIFVNPKPEAAGSLIEKAGLKGYRVGQAQISPLHANFIINLGGASCDDVLQLISRVKETVKEELNVTLQEEVKIVGEF